MPTIDELLKLVKYYEAQLTADQIDLYLDALSDIDAEILHAAAIELVRTARFMPRISEIRQTAQAIQERQESNLIMDIHQERNERKFSPWLVINSWERMSPGNTLSIDWQICPECGAKFANWPACPDCKVEAL